MTLAAWFPHRVCLNLDRRPERWAHAQEQFRQHGLAPVERFAALDGLKLELPDDWDRSPGAYGCLRSHLAVVRAARAQGHGQVLILEDDVVFAEGLAARLARVMDELPQDWEMLSLGGYHEQAPVQVSDHLARMTKTYSTHAYVVRDSLYDAFIELNQGSSLPVDVNNTLLQQAFKCYCVLPHLAWQRDGWSDVQMDEESHWAIRESLITVGDEIAALIADTQLVLAYRPQADAGLSLKNLEHVVQFYHADFPSMGQLVLADKRELAPAQLPSFCRFLGVDGEDLDRVRMFRRGYDACPNGAYFIFSDGFVRPSLPRFVVPNLLMCQRYGGASYFDTLVPLDDADSAAVRAGQKKSVRFERYAPEPVVAAEVGAFMLSRSTLESLPGGEITGLEHHGLFRSPNRGLALKG